MKKSVRIYVSGSVQPMFFGPYIKEEADKLDVRGYVRNHDDGRVEIFLEGAYNAVQEMIPKCKQGPFSTQIKKFEQNDERFQDFKDFKILKI